MTAELRGLSLLPPWAHLVATGAKRWETRGTRVARPGQRLLIASSARWTDAGRHVALGWRLPDLLAVYPPAGDGPVEHALPLGVGLAVVTVEAVGVVEHWGYRSVTHRAMGGPVQSAEPVARVAWDGGGHNPITEQERSLGDYRLGRRVLALGPPARLPEPVPVRGMPGVYPLPDRVVAAVLGQL